MLARCSQRESCSKRSRHSCGAPLPAVPFFLRTAAPTYTDDHQPCTPPPTHLPPHSRGTAWRCGAPCATRQRQRSRTSSRTWVCGWVWAGGRRHEAYRCVAGAARSHSSHSSHSRKEQQQQKGRQARRQGPSHFGDPGTVALVSAVCVTSQLPGLFRLEGQAAAGLGGRRVARQRASQPQSAPCATQCHSISAGTAAAAAAAAAAHVLKVTIKAHTTPHQPAQNQHPKPSYSGSHPRRSARPLCT